VFRIGTVYSGRWFIVGQIFISAICRANRLHPQVVKNNLENIYA